MTVFGRAILASMTAVLFALGQPAEAQEALLETRVAEEGSESPPATLDSVAWLVGQWRGEGVQGAPAMESWLSPAGGTMVGTFVQETSDGGIMFTEHMYLMEEAGSLILRLKHFNADLTGWEEKDGMLTFRLVAIEECAAYFDALTLRCDGPGGLVAAVRMKSDKAEPQELVFRFRSSARVSSGSAQSEPASCVDAITTPDLNECYAEQLDAANTRRAKYLAAALARTEDRPELAAKIIVSDAAFAAYRNEECGAVYEDWKDGTIRGVMALTCQISMTDARTHRVWQNWLTFMDSTPPVLPEPMPTQ